jgi:lysozyme
LLSLLRQQEGFSPKLYKDSGGYWTIGYGFCLDKISFKRSWAEYILNDIVNDRYLEMLNRVPQFRLLSDARKAVLVDMSFQMGVDGVLGFHDTLKALDAKDFALAAQHMLASKWAKQTPSRAQQLAWMLEYDRISMGGN